MKKLVLDAGHGFFTPGKRTCDGSGGIVREWTMNANVCNYIAEILKDYDVEITRVDDVTGQTDVPVQTRTNKINSINPDLFISIHHNGNTGNWGTWSYVCTFYNVNKPQRDVDLAVILAAEISKLTGIKNSGGLPDTKSAVGSLHMVRETKPAIPSVLCEGGFMDSTIDYPIITSEKGQRAYAQAVANVAISYLGLTKKAATGSNTTATVTGTTTAERAASILELVKADGIKNKICPSVKAAQFIIESDYGRSELAVSANNCHGMKASLSGNTWAGSKWDGKSVYAKVTQEQRTDGVLYSVVADFRRYTSIYDSIADHSAYLLGAKNGSKLRFAGLIDTANYREQITIIKNGGYATDVTYVDKICKVIEQFNLNKYDSQMGGGTAMKETKTAKITYDDIKVTIDGKSTTLKDLEGRAIEPFLMNDTMYVPISPLVRQFGKSSTYDTKTKTLVIK